MKILLLLFMVCCNIVTAQLLTVNNLRHLTTGSLLHLDSKLTDHFSLERNTGMEEQGNRVYAASNQHIDRFKVLTVFTEAKNCLALSLVTHDPEEVKDFHEDLVKEGFTISEYKDAKGNPGKKYTHESFIVTIKDLLPDIPAHQIVWRCR